MYHLPVRWIAAFYGQSCNSACKYCYRRKEACPLLYCLRNMEGLRRVEMRDPSITTIKAIGRFSKPKSLLSQKRLHSQKKLLMEVTGFILLILIYFFNVTFSFVVFTFQYSWRSFILKPVYYMFCFC